MTTKAPVYRLVGPYDNERMAKFATPYDAHEAFYRRLYALKVATSVVSDLWAERGIPRPTCTTYDERLVPMLMGWDAKPDLDNDIFIIPRYERGYWVSRLRGRTAVPAGKRELWSSLMDDYNETYARLPELALSEGYLDVLGISRMDNIFTPLQARIAFDATNRQVYVQTENSIKIPVEPASQELFDKLRAEIDENKVLGFNAVKPYLLKRFPEAEEYINGLY